MNSKTKSYTTKTYAVALFAVCALAYSSIAFGQGRNREITIDDRTIRDLDVNPAPTKPQSQDSNQNLQVVTGEEIESLIDNLAGGLPKVVKTRVFSWGQLVNVEGAGFVSQALRGIFDPTARELVVQSKFNGSPVLEDYRFLELNDQLVILRDLYLDGPSADLSVGHGIPIELEDNAAKGLEALKLKSLQAAAAPRPTIVSIGGESSSAAGISNGLVSMSCGTSWNGSRVVNDQAGSYRWYIYGSNLGSAQGSVQLAGRAAQINQWSATQITISPTAPYSSGPVCALLTINTSNGAVNYAVNIVPSIRTRIYGQCTWYVALARLNMGKQPSPTAYSGYSQISSGWVPQRGDQLQWNGSHTAIISAVSGPTSQTGGYLTWNVTV